MGTSVEHCYAWDVFNGTGLDADGLSVRLTGVQSVSTVYTGDANPLGEPRPVSGFDAPTGSYLLDLGDNAVTVAPGDSTRVGLCSPNAVSGATTTHPCDAKWRERKWLVAPKPRSPCEYTCTG